MTEERIFLNFAIKEIKPNKTYTVNNEFGDYVRWNIGNNILHNFHNKVAKGNEIQKQFKESGLQKDVVWVELEYRLDHQYEYNKYIALPLRKNDVNEFISDACKYQLSINRETLPNIQNELGGSNIFEYPFGL